jgi:pSer/pThr/pTyr-binding forkhead associated (FHA) protein
MADEIVATLKWEDPETHEILEYQLATGATITIGRSANNDIQIAEQHVSRQHAVINYRDGVFMINDLNSSNGTFVNDNQVQEPFPLFAGDEIRLYVPIIKFLAYQTGHSPEGPSTVIKATNPAGQGSLIVTNGPQEGQTIPLLLNRITIGRATSNATWEVLLQDPSVSRPHARLEKKEEAWRLTDLGSSNGTRVNNKVVDARFPAMLQDGDTIELGSSVLVFRTGWKSPDDTSANKIDRTIPRR